MPASARGRASLAALALGLIGCAAAAPPPAGDIAGRYRHEAPVAATLEVRADGAQYVLRLEGGGPEDVGAAAPADCVIEARGELEGATLHASFGPVETDTFAYGAVQAAREGRSVEIRFESGAAEVTEADTFGYCGLDAEFTGRYREEG
jgi:hypothetical protein